MKTRYDLALYFNELGFKTGAEIGVWDGVFSEVLCKSIPGLKLYSIDCWETYKGYKDHTLNHNMQNAYEVAKTRLEPYGAILIKKFSMDAVKDFADESLDFVFIDGNHEYEFVKEDINAWAPKVRKGGIVSGHDYYHFPSGRGGIIKAVNEYVAEHDIELQLTEWNKENPLRDERQPSWYFTKI
jgi:hypothetical protein